MLSAPPLTPAQSAAIPARPTPAPARRLLVWGMLMALIALLYVGASVGPALFDQNEAQYAGAVREMMNRPQDYLPATRERLERGHWFLPTNDGIPRLQKPPFVYWLLMGSMRIFGVNEFGARLPNALFSLLWFWATFLLGRRVGGTAVGAAAATILATMAGTFIFSHLIAPEPFLAAFLTLTFWCFLAACQEPARAGRWMFGAWVCMALGVGSKGLHGALYPLAVAGWLAWRYPGTRPVWKRLLHPAGPLVFLAMLIPWYAVIAVRFPGFLHDQFINEQWGHVINRRYPPDSDRVPFLNFCAEHLVFFLPWTFFIPAAIGARRASADDPRSDALGRDLLVGWFVVTAGSLLFSSLQDYYLMTAWTPVAFWLAQPWASEQTGRSLPRWMRSFPGWCLAGVGLVVLAAAVYLHAQTIPAGPGPIAAPTDVRNTIAATLAGFSTAAWHQLLPLVWAAGGLFLAGGAGLIFLAARGRWRATLPVTAVTMTGVLVVAACGLNVLEDCFSLKRIALVANRLAGPAGEVVCAGLPEDNPSLFFYLNREIHWVHARSNAAFASRELGIGRELFLSDEEFARRWHSPETVLLVAESDEITQWRNRLGASASELQPVAQSGTRVLLVNHAASSN